MADVRESLLEKIKLLPETPGVYQYYDGSGKILYVGKAKNLKKRVSSYFNKTLENNKTKILVRKIEDIQYIVVNTELDALLLENNLIKKHQPKYNIQLKDDKTYPWICIKNERFPRVYSTRKVVKDGSKYFGPYSSVKVMRTLLDLIRELFPLRTCNLDLDPKKINEGRFKVCLEYHIGNCLGPCEALQSEQSYNEQIDQIEAILKGNLSTVSSYLKNKMQTHARKHEYEQAHKLKEKLKVLENFQAKSTVVSPKIHEVDVLTFIDDHNRAFINYLCIANGSIVHAYTTEIKKKLDESRDEILDLVYTEMREKFDSQAKELIVEEPFNSLIDSVQQLVPRIGDKKHLLELSRRNAGYYKLERLKQEKIKHPEKHTNRILEQLKKDFHLSELPVHIECFDNSNIQGTHPVAACVVFKNTKPSTKDYRHFNIKTVVGPDDFASMEEVVFRRYSRLLEENQSLPQLIVIDGGKGQISSAVTALERLNLRGKIAIVGIAKKLEEIFFPGDQVPIYLDKRSESLKVVQYMRNEAHRFGITFHRNKRSKAALGSSLLDVEGIGAKTQEVLLKKFKKISVIKSASLEELTEVIGKAKAKVLFSHFQSSEI